MNVYQHLTHKLPDCVGRYAIHCHTIHVASCSTWPVLCVAYLHIIYIYLHVFNVFQQCKGETNIVKPWTRQCLWKESSQVTKDRPWTKSPVSIEIIWNHPFVCQVSMILNDFDLCHLCLGHCLHPLNVVCLQVCIFLGWPCAVLMDNFGMIPDKFGWLWDPNGTGQSGSLHLWYMHRNNPTRA